MHAMYNYVNIAEGVLRWGKRSKYHIVTAERCRYIQCYSSEGHLDEEDTFLFLSTHTQCDNVKTKEVIFEKWPPLLTNPDVSGILGMLSSLSVTDLSVAV